MGIHIPSLGAKELEFPNHMIELDWGFTQLHLFFGAARAKSQRCCARR